MWNGISLAAWPLFCTSANAFGKSADIVSDRAICTTPDLRLDPASTDQGAQPEMTAYTDAISWAAQLHGDTQRKHWPAPLLAHLVAVSSLVWEDGGDEEQAIGALLHDALVYGNCSLNEVDRRFGGRVALIARFASVPHRCPPAAARLWRPASGSAAQRSPCLSAAQPQRFCTVALARPERSKLWLCTAGRLLVAGVPGWAAA